MGILWGFLRGNSRNKPLIQEYSFGQGKAFGPHPLKPDIHELYRSETVASNFYDGGVQNVPEEGRISGHSKGNNLRVTRWTVVLPRSVTVECIWCYLGILRGTCPFYSATPLSSEVVTEVSCSNREFLLTPVKQIKTAREGLPGTLKVTMEGGTVETARNSPFDPPNSPFSACLRTFLAPFVRSPTGNS